MDRTDRYTSPALSRQLAESGIEQHVHEYGSPNYMRCCHYPCWSRFEDEWVMNDRGNVYTASPLVRALDLTDVLHEIETFSSPLFREWAINTCDVGYAAHVYGPGQNDCVPLFEEAHPESVVEAAGLVLLALLRERKP